MHFFLSYSEELNHNPVEYTDDNDFISDIKGTYKTKLNLFDKLIPSSFFRYLNRKNGSIIKISDFGIKNPESKWLNWEDIDYIKTRTNKLELSSRMGDIVNISYLIEDFDLIALKILKLATPLEASNWFKQITFKPQKTIFHYLNYYFFVGRIIIMAILLIWSPFYYVSSEGPFILEIVVSLFCLYEAYYYIFSQFIESTSIQESSIFFYEGSILMNAIFPNLFNPYVYEFDISDICNITVDVNQISLLQSDLYLTISLLKRDGNIISLIPGGGPINSVDPIPIYYRLQSILVNQK